MRRKTRLGTFPDADVWRGARNWEPTRRSGVVAMGLQLEARSVEPIHRKRATANRGSKRSHLLSGTEKFGTEQVEDLIESGASGLARFVDQMFSQYGVGRHDGAGVSVLFV